MFGVASGNSHTYITQWLETATGGNVKVEFALIADRVRFKCLKCGLTHTAPAIKDSTCIDFGIQEFVKLHAHKTGGWKCYRCQQFIEKSITEHAIECEEWMKAVSKATQKVTADFKPVGGGKIDDPYQKELKIKEVAAKLDAEYAAKLDDNAIAKKIKEL